MTVVTNPQQRTETSADLTQAGQAVGEQKSLISRIVDTVMGWINSIIDFVAGIFNPSGSSPRVSSDGTARIGKLIIDAKSVPAWEAYKEANKGVEVEFTNPVRGGFAEITRDFGKRFHPLHKEMRHHDGVDLKPLRDNQQIEASAAGIVLFAGVKEGYGNTVVIGHSDGSWTLYAHLRDKPDANLVGNEVSQRQQLGVMGSSGDSTGVHLHYEQGKGTSRITPRVAEVGELKAGVQYADNGRQDTKIAGLVKPEEHKRLQSGAANRGDEQRPTIFVRNGRTAAEAQVS